MLRAGAETAVSVATTEVKSDAGVQSSSCVADIQSPATPQWQRVKQLRLRTAACYLPHPEKEHYGGEDAHFVSRVGGGAVGVADGVGGWAESGINPAEYSRTFMRVACAFVEGTCTRSAAASPSSSLDDGLPPAAAAAAQSLDEEEAAAAAGVLDPRGALDEAHRLTRLPGSATACVLQLCPERKQLVAANLGDSGFMVIKHGAVALRSAALEHFFDCPLQFGAFPEHVEATDSVEQAQLYHVPVEPGDIIIAGSDGLWDNMDEPDVLALAPKDAGHVDSAAAAIASLARCHAADPEYVSPYVREAKAQGLDWPWWMKLQNVRFKDGRLQLGELAGGKMDDITVLVAMVEEAEVEVPLTAGDWVSPANGGSMRKNGASV